MYTIVIEIAGIILILSSLVSFILLLKRNFQQCKTSPLYILVISDILSSALISVLLFFNQYKDTKFGDSEGSTNNDIMKLLKKINETDDEEDKTANCDLRVILMNYALFIIPFVNSFISLLSMSIQYNCDAEILYTKCRKLMNFYDSTQTRRNNPVFTHLSQKKKTVTAMSVVSQWAVPILSTATLLLASHKNSADIRSADMTCGLTTNFPFENCYFVISDSDTEASNSTGHLLVDKNNYIDEVALERLEPNSTATDEVVSNVYGIVESVLASSGIKPERPEGYYDSMQLMNVTSFMKIPNKPYEEDEIRLFEDLMKNVSKQYVSHVSTETVIYTASTENPSTTSINPANMTSNAEIFKNIVQKIYSNKFNVRSKIKQQLLPKGRYINEDGQMLMWDEKIDEDDVQFQVTSSCMTNQCFISTTFLKIHLFLLMIFIYFGPILLSTIFNMRSNYICSNALEKLEISDRMETQVSSPELNLPGPNKPSKFGWLGPKHESAEPGNTSKNEESQVERSIIKVEESLPSMRDEVEEMEKLSRTFKTSLTTGVVLWSPMFLQVLMKVFLCSDLPMWLTQLFYFMAISYGAVRNYFNLRILRSSAILTNGFKKKNVVHPTPGLSMGQSE